MKFMIPLSLLFAFPLNAAERPSHSSRAQKERQAMRAPDRLKVGDDAPAFKLKSADGRREVELDSFKGKRPVVLVFGSFT